MRLRIVIPAEAGIHYYNLFYHLSLDFYKVNRNSGFPPARE